MKERLDAIVLRKGWAQGRDEAQTLVRNGSVRVNALVRTDPGIRSEYDRVTLDEDPSAKKYVSRGGHKLKFCLDFFGLSVAGLSVVDMGASTGGFTDCLLQEGAASVWAVDVGKGLLDWGLRADRRVTAVESANVRYRGDWMPADPVQGVVADLSFISLASVLPSVMYLLRAGGWFLPLVKPQFEASPGMIGRGGVVRDLRVRQDVLRRLILQMDGVGLEIRGLTPSAILGRKGNQEYFFYSIGKGSP